MESATGFKVHYELTEADWSAARRKFDDEPPGSGYEQGLWQDYDDVFLTRVQMTYAGTRLFPVSTSTALYRWLIADSTERGVPAPDFPPNHELERGLPMVLFSLAWHFALLVIESLLNEAPDGSMIPVTLEEGGTYLTFETKGPVVSIGSNYMFSPMLEVPKDELIAGIKRFLHDFGHETQRHAPELLDWKVYDGVKRFM